MITPTRFGLKYAPVPTLALEYEDSASSMEEPGSASSLFVLREGEPPRRVKKLHVVELPMLNRTSEPKAIAEQLQRDNSRFLAPSVVNENQLRRLLGLLIEHLQAAPAALPPPQVVVSSGGVGARADDADKEEEGGDDDEAHEESLIEESMAESSQALESSEAPSEPPPARLIDTMPSAAPVIKDVSSRGTFLSQEESESEGEQEKEAEESRASAQENRGDEEDDHYDSPDKEAVKVSRTEPPDTDEQTKPDTESDKEDYAEKKMTLKSESEVSEEDIESEELEYFSEDGSDEDSF